MANVKEVLITGMITFDANPPETIFESRPEKVTRLLASFNIPTFGLRITYRAENSARVPNAYGGQTTFIEFTIAGREAVSWDALRDDVETLKTIAAIQFARARDIEASTGREWLDLLNTVDRQDKPWQIELINKCYNTVGAV